ncbi:serine/arginine repetitive matrix protein 2-like [Amphibalanus amphitrite]|uniref:serine/arginine repetitive matrix protein 2-like n=1 Tax=Amphibalanus amphitrite TaxID=1232801 RepID=UPI001C911A59|nr:serine/arginine repetitive matrix protein 2-like [Amphibalanus amphitrite]
MRSHLSLRGVTPERAEFENSVCDPMSEDELLSEIDEDEWTDRNFLTTEEVLSGADCSDSDSCSPDSDQFEPALDDEEVLRLAERWRRLHDQPEPERRPPDQEPDSDRYESDGVERAGDASDTGHQSETEEEVSERLRRRAEDGLTEHVLRSNSPRKRTNGQGPQVSGPERVSQPRRSAGDSSSAASDTEIELRPPLPPAAAPRIVVQDTERPPDPDPELPEHRPEPIGAERDSHGSGSGSGSGKRKSSQERKAADVGRGDSKEKGKQKSPRKDIGKKITGSIPVLKKPVSSLIGRGVGKPASGKTVTTARVSVSTLVQQKPNKTTSATSEDAAAKPTRDIRRHSAQRSRPPASDSAAWRNSTELKRRSLVSSPSSTPAAVSPARSRSAADLGSRIGAATGRVNQGQQAAKNVASEGTRKPAATRQPSAEMTRPSATKIPTRPQPAPRASITNGAPRPVAARRTSPPERKTSAPAKLLTEKSEGAVEQPNLKADTGKLGKSAPIRRGSGGNRVAAIAARDRVRRQVKENLMKQRMARKAREEANKSNGRRSGAQRRRSQEVEATSDTTRSDDVDQGAAREEEERRISSEEWDDGEKRRRRDSTRRDDEVMSGSSEGRDASYRRTRKNRADKLSSPDKLSSSAEADSASEAISGCETSVEVRLPGPDDDAAMHSSEEDSTHSEREVRRNHESDGHASAVESGSKVKREHSRDSRHSQEHIPKNLSDLGVRGLLEDDVDDIHLSLSGAEEFDDVALEQRWRQMLGDDDELMETENIDTKPERSLYTAPNADEARPLYVPADYQRQSDAESEEEVSPAAPSEPEDQQERSGEGDTFLEFDALLNDVDVTNLERGFDNICDDGDYDEELSEEDESSGRENVTITEVTANGKEQTDDEASSSELERRGSPSDNDHFSSHHSDAASDLSDVDSYVHHDEDIYDKPSTGRSLCSPESPEHAEDAAWVTADSTALDSREAPESCDEETAWQTAESTSLDTTPAEVSRNESGLRPEECALPPDEESISEEEEQEPAWKAVNDHEDASFSDQEDRVPRLERGEEESNGTASEEAVFKKSPQFKLDESFITFRRRRRASPPPRKVSPAPRDSSPDAIESHEEAPSPAAGSTASPPPIIDLTQDSPEPADSERKVVADSERIEASMEFNQEWVDEWREVDETVSSWMSEAKREQWRGPQAPEERRDTPAPEERRGSHGLRDERRSQTPEERRSAQMPEKRRSQTSEGWREAESPEGRRETQVQQEQRSPTPERRRTQTPEDLSIEMEPDVDEVIVIETRPVMSEEPHVRPTAAEATMDENESVSWEDMVSTADEMSSDGGSKVDDRRPHEQSEVREVTESKVSEAQHNVVSDELSNIPTKKERMNVLPSKLNESDAISPLSISEEDSPKHDVLPELRLFGGDETTEIVSSRKRSSEKNVNSKLPSLGDRIKSGENEAVITTAKSRETKAARDSVRAEPVASARSKAKIPDQPSTKGPGATSTPLASSRPPLTSLPTPITNTEQTPEPPVSSALYRLIHQTPSTEQSPVWEWETPPIPRPPPSTRPPPIPVSELEPQPSPGPPPASVRAPERKGVTQPLPALSAPAAVLAATAIGTPATSVPVATPTTSPVTVPVATPAAPVPAARSSARISPSTSTQVSAASVVPTVTLASSVASRVSSAPRAAAPAVPTSGAVPPGQPDFLLRSAYVSAAVQKTRPAPVRVSPLARIWPPVSSTEAVSSPSWLTSKVTPTVITAPLATSPVPGSPISPVSPTSPTTRTTPAVVSSRVAPVKPARPTLPPLPLSSTTPDTGKNVRPAPRSTAVTTSRFASTTPTSLTPPAVASSSPTPVSPTVHSTPSTPVTPPIPVPPSTPTSPSAPTTPLVRPPRAAQIRVSPLVEEVSARLLRRGATEPSLVLPPRSALSGAPMRLSRLPEDLVQTTPQEPAQERPPEESLIRDLVLSRVRRSPEKQIRKRVTSPALLGTSGPSVRPLPPPVPKSDVEENGEAEEEGEVIPPPPLTATRRLIPPAPPPIPTSEEATQPEASNVTEKKPDAGAEQAQAAKHNIIDFSPVVPFIDDSPSSVQDDETKTTPSTTHETVSETADEPPHQPERVDQPPPLPDKTRGSARLSLIPAAARALFSPPRRPPRASDQRTPRRKKQSAADRKAVLSMPPDVGGTMTIAGENELRPVSDLHGSLENETSALGMSSRLDSPSTTKKAQSTDLKSMAASPNRKTASSTPALTAVSSTDTTPAVSAADLSNKKLSPERDTSPNVKSQPPQSSIASPGSVDSGVISPPKDESSDLLSTSRTGEAAEPSTQEQTQETAPDGKDGKTSGSRVVLTEPSTPTTRKKKESSDLKKKRERRRSIIQTISDMFRHSTDKKEKDKEKDDGPDSSLPSKKEVAAAVAPSPPSATDVSASPSPLAVAAGVKQTPLRNRLGLRFRKSKDKDKKLSASPSLSPPGTPVSADVTDSPSITDAVQRSQAAPEAKVTPSGRSSPEGTLSRRSRSGRAARHSEIRRQQRAQELQRQLGEVEVRQQELQLCADELEKTIRGETSDGCGELTDDAALMRDWFALVHERSLLVRRDQLLQLQLQELQLEDRHDRLQLELRERMASPEPQKSAEDIERERELVNTLLEISDQRRALRQAMDAEQDALRAECESAEARQQLLAAPPAPALLEESTV